MILRAIQAWLHRRRLRAAGKRMTALGPATDAEWFQDKSVWYIATSADESKSPYRIPGTYFQERW